MQYCEHEDVAVDIADDALDTGHVVSCNACGRWWRYYMDRRVAWGHFNGWQRPGASGSYASETVHVVCTR